MGALAWLRKSFDRLAVGGHDTAARVRVGDVQPLHQLAVTRTRHGEGQYDQGDPAMIPPVGDDTVLDRGA